MTAYERFRGQWNFLRRLTLDLLGAADLGYSPGKGLGPFWKQFRHVGRFQANLLDALDTGRVDFGAPTEGYQGGADRDALAAYLSGLDEWMNAALGQADWARTIDWEGRSIDLADHCMRLAEHETLHDGEWVAYLRLAGRAFPPSWRAWGF